MLGLLAVIIIHSTPFDELAQSTELPQNNKEFSLKGGRTIVVQEIQFQGNSAISTQQLQRVTNIYLNRPIAESDLAEIQEKVKNLYQNKGYSSVNVMIPAKPKGGVLTVIIDEGKKTKGN